MTDTSSNVAGATVSSYTCALASSSTSSLLLDAQSSGTSTPPTRRVHKFFDSYPRFTRRPADLNARNSAYAHPSSSPSPQHQSVAATAAATIQSLTSSLSAIPPSTPPYVSSEGLGTPASSRSTSDECVPLPLHSGHEPLGVIGVPPENVIWSAHYGYVYCMALVPSSREGSDDPVVGERGVQLVTGSGDATVKVRLVMYVQRPFCLLRTCGSGFPVILIWTSE